MAIDKKIDKELHMVKNLQSLTIVYEEIAVMKINTTKSSVLQTREFLDKLSKVFANIKLSYKHHMLEQLEGKNPAKIEITGSKKNGKEIHVLLSANNRMYGDIINHVFEQFYRVSQTSPGDIVVLGEVGKTMYEEQKNHKPYSYFALSDGTIDFKEIRPIIRLLKEYEKVFIYYGKFKSMMIQESTVSDISGNQPIESSKQQAEEVEPFLFEPSIEHVHDEFETQIFYALFMQTLQEIALARSASRIKAMEKTNENIHIRLSDLVKQSKRMSELVQNKHQLQQMVQLRYVKKRRITAG